MKIFNNITELVGNTPLIKLNNFEKENNITGTLLAKLESFNPAGSAKDRIAKNMIETAEKQGLLKTDSVIIEPTSGNTGIGLAAICASKGYKAIFTMPETMSVERQKLLRAYGAEIVLTDGEKGMKGAIDKAIELSNEIRNSFIPSQFENKANPEAHFLTTGPEIWDDTLGDVDIFVSAIGTGGTISGTAKFLKLKNKGIKVYGVEPSNSPFITKGVAGKHKIQGIGAGFIPDTLDLSVIDEVITVSDEDAIKTVQIMARSEGILAGISSGAALFGATQILKRPENKDKTLVVVLPDTGERYLSSDIF